MPYATLGGMTFEGLLSPENLRVQQAEKYAVVALASGKPRLQRIGSELDEISFPIKFHTMFCDPNAELEKLRAARQNAEILPLTTGAGELLGRFVITQVSVSRTQMSHTGGLVEAVADVTLLEFYDPDEAATDEAAAMDAAFANDTRKVVSVQNVAVVQQPAAIVSQEARATASHAGAAAKEAKKAASNAAEAASLLRKAKQQVEAAREAVERVQAELQANIALVQKAPEMLAAAQAVAAYIPSVLAAIASGDAQGAFSESNALGALSTDMVNKGINIETALLKRTG